MSAGTALLHLVFIGAMLFLLTGGTVGLLMLWYLRGRDPHVGKMAEYLEQPPDDLPPGAAGTLIDEHADHRDVVATLVGLGRTGAVTITEVGGGASAGSGRRQVAHDYLITVVDPAGVTSRVDQTLLRILFAGDPEPGRAVPLSEVRGRFTAAEPQIRDALYQAMVDRGYFRVSPAVTRKRWRRLAWVGLALSVIVGLVLTIRVDPFALLATIAAAILFLALVRMSRVMPQKTALGAEQSQKWRAFRRYLASIEKYENLAAASSLFDRYFAYAIAFDLQDKWVKQFARAGARKPGWFTAVGDVGGGTGDIGDVIFDAMTIGHMTGHLGGDVDLPNVDLPNVGMPNMPDLGNVDLQGMADVLGGSLQGASDGLSGLLDAAGSIFDAIDFDGFN